MVTLGYQGEDLRYPVLMDLLHMAFVCDLTRVASVQVSMFQSFLNLNSVLGINLDVHETSHATNSQTVGRIIGWHMKYYGYLVDKLRNTPEGDSNVLASSALVYVSEGGLGFSGENGNDDSSHSTEGMVALVAGRAGGLKPGQHLKTNGLHPVNVMLTAMQAVGVNASALGEVTGTVPGLR